MNRTEFHGMCELVNDGELIWVEQINSDIKGRVVGCKSDCIEVEIGNRCETWTPHECSAMTHGFKVNYHEVMTHPHEYDTHLD